MSRMIEVTNKSLSDIKVGTEIRHGQIELINQFCKDNNIKYCTLVMIGYNPDLEPVWRITECL